MYYFLLMCFFSAMAVHCYTDMREQLLYDKVNVFLAGCGLWYGYFFTSPQVYLTGALVMGGIMLSIYWAKAGAEWNGFRNFLPAAAAQNNSDNPTQNEGQQQT